jgi:N6-L-threonylcarbamoyladenine synthase
MPILAIETSCDDTCAAVLEGACILSNVISSQAAAHAGFGGVVPEVASRHHLELAAPVVEAALGEAGTSLDQIEAVAVTVGPGLIGALLVGVSIAKAIAAPRRLPLIPVDHLRGHVAANFLEPDPLEPPFLCLLASGGHTLLAGVRDHEGYELLGQTLDDAAGEAFDKVARLLGLGYPGGPALEKLAAEGDPGAFEMPVAMSRDPGLDFSFSGLKTALVYLCRDLGPEQVDTRRADLAASFQSAAVGQLVAKLERALKRGEWDAVALGGGVAANGPLRDAVAVLCDRNGVELKLVPLALCTDNAAMIGSAARFATPIPYPGYLTFDAFPTRKPPADGPIRQVSLDVSFGPVGPAHDCGHCLLAAGVPPLRRGPRLARRPA